MKTLKISKSKDRGFALIATISIMTLLVVISLAMFTTSNQSTNSSSNVDYMTQARANARLALNEAISALQESAGPDQSITAKASVLDQTDLSSFAIPTPFAVDSKRSNWTGVWDASSFDPSDPTTRPFKKWLVSTPDAASASTTAYVANSGTDDIILLSEYSVTDSTGADQILSEAVAVPKVEITNNSTSTKSHFAYWVEDQGVKADLSWNESDSDTTRLVASPGVDYKVLEGPFDSITPTYPISKNNNEAWLEGIEKAYSLDTIPIAVGSDAQRSWLKTNRHHVTLGNLGVISDSKNGGLRKDLSLAFEMDGDAEAENATNFNNQTSVFVGNGNTSTDPLSAPEKASGMPTYERFLFRDYKTAGNTFSDDISANDVGGYDVTKLRNESVLRGPNWWALRDYANLYKRLKGSSNDYTLKARSYFPNRSSEGQAYSDLFDTAGTWGDQWDMEERTYFNDRSSTSPTPHYIYRPARPTYAPVNLGMISLLGLRTESDGSDMYDLSITIDPIFYIWNPYNHKIEFDSLAIALETSFPGSYYIEVSSDGLASDGTTYEEVDKKIYLGQFDDLLEANLTNLTDDSTVVFFVDDNGSSITMNPGEVMLVTPTSSVITSSGKVNAGAASPGNFNNGFTDTGIIVKTLGALDENDEIQHTETVKIKETDNVRAAFVLNNNGASSDRFYIDTSIPEPTATLSSILSGADPIGEQVQHTHMQVSRENDDLQEYFTAGIETLKITKVVETQTDGNINTYSTVSASTLNDLSTYLGSKAPYNADSLVNNKEFFGLLSQVMKPAQMNSAYPNPFEVFSRFNPKPMLIHKDFWRTCSLNQLYMHLDINSGQSVELDFGISFDNTTDSRNIFWGGSLDGNTGGTVNVPMSQIPTTPLYSLAEFANANLSLMASDPARAVGNSWSHPIISPVSVYGDVITDGGTTKEDFTAADLSWLLNDALFDSYYLSGLAPDFTITSSGYQRTNSTLTVTEDLEETVITFFSSNSQNAKASPIITPYQPNGKNAQEITTEIIGSDGYKKLGAYTLIKGSFNVNSTSTKAWEALLRANKGLEVSYSDGNTDDDPTSTPFPRSSMPSPEITEYWSGMARLTDAQITNLAEKIVEQVKLRGPFMSISDFVNHRVGGTIDANMHYTGALQAAIDLTTPSINTNVRNNANGMAPEYDTIYTPGLPNSALPTDAVSTTGIATDITQADILLSLAPRISVRSDTFLIRAYGEVSDEAGIVLASAYCEATIQRLPEYVDSSNNEPWDDMTNLSSINQTFGRRLKITNFRWLTEDDI